MQNGKSGRIFMLAISLLLISLVVTSPVLAAGPERIFIELNETYQMTDLCAFPITVQQSGFFTIMVWPETDSGTHKEIETYGNANATWTANGKTLSAKVSGPLHSEYLSPTEVILSFSGPAMFLVAPGYGPLFYGTGRFVARYLIDDGFYLIQEVLMDVGPFITDPTDLCAYFEG